MPGRRVWFPEKNCGVRGSSWARWEYIANRAIFRAFDEGRVVRCWLFAKTGDPRITKRTANSERRTTSDNPGLPPCGSHLRMKGPPQDGKTGFLRSLASALEAHSPLCRRGRPGFFFAGGLFHLQRPEQ